MYIQHGVPVTTILEYSRHPVRLQLFCCIWSGCGYHTVFCICISLWWLMMLSIFICAHGSFVHLLWRNVYLDTLSIFNWLAYLIFSFLIYKYFYTLYTQIPYQKYDLQTSFLHFAGFFLTLLTAPFKAQQPMCIFLLLLFLALLSSLAFTLELDSFWATFIHL